MTNHCLLKVFNDIIRAKNPNILHVFDCEPRQVQSLQYVATKIGVQILKLGLLTFFLKKILLFAFM